MTHVMPMGFTTINTFNATANMTFPSALPFSTTTTAFGMSYMPRKLLRSNNATRQKMTTRDGVTLDAHVLGGAVQMGTVSGTALGVWGSCEWQLLAAPGGTYNIRSTTSGRFLSVAIEGHQVDTWPTDDGSGRQRFVFVQTGPGQYRIRVAHGKSDGLTWLRATSGGFGVGLATARDTSTRAQWMIKRVPPKSPPPSAGNFPAGVAEKLFKVTALDATQLDAVLGMIQGPEQARTEWWLDADGGSVYGYAEDIGDGRGVTIGLYGATTGRGYDDATRLFAAYGRPDVPGMKPKDIVKAVRSFATDPKWQTAMWDSYIAEYIAPTKAMLPYASALTFGAVLDASMNAGLDDDSGKSWGSRHLVREAAASTRTEAAFVAELLRLRRAYPTEHSGDMTRRIDAWERLLKDNRWDMRVDVDKYAYIP
jgi:chitosanase